jgi:hypothetical protein
MANAKSDVPASLWQPLRSSTFRNLLIADVVSDVGTFMQSVGAAWLMVSLNRHRFHCWKRRECPLFVCARDLCSRKNLA